MHSAIDASIIALVGTRFHAYRLDTINLAVDYYADGHDKDKRTRSLLYKGCVMAVMRLKEFYEDNVGRSFTGILSDFARRKK